MQCDIKDGMMVSEDVIGGHIISKRGGGGTTHGLGVTPRPEY